MEAESLIELVSEQTEDAKESSNTAFSYHMRAVLFTWNIRIRGIKMICGMTYYQICWYFLIYSFGGWALEVVYHAVACGKVINRGFLNGPVCPVYGFGVLSVFAMMNTFQGSGYQLNDGMIFLFGVILATAVELIAGWLLDVCFHARWWDYSNKPLNFHGYICLEFSLIWGVAILLVVKVFQSFVEHHTSAHAPSIVGWMVVAILYALYLLDLIVTVAVIQGLNRKLTRLDTIRANMRVISDKISDGRITTPISCFGGAYIFNQ